MLPLFLACALFASAEPAHPAAPTAKLTKAEIEKGRAIYLSNCSICHGTTGEGGRGPNLAGGIARHGRTAAEVRRTITKGIKGSQMPAFGYFEPVELNRLIGLVQSLRESHVARETASGDAARGKAIYADQGCSTCHLLGKEGSIYGPELTHVGSSRPLKYLRASIATPSADVPSEYQGVAVTLNDGTRVIGVRVNEDTFTVQLRDLRQRFRMFRKEDVRSVEELKESLMPPFPLPAKDLDDLVAYLASLTDEPPASGPARSAEGIR